MVRLGRSGDLSGGRENPVKAVGHVAVEAFAGSRERDRAMSAPKEAGSQRGLKTPDRLTDRRLSDPQFLRRSGKRVEARGCLEENRLCTEPM